MKDVLKPETKVTPAADAAPPIIINNIDVRPVNRTTQDIPNWRSAIKNAEARTPRRTMLYDLYADVLLDGHVVAVIGKRLDAVTTANWQFINKEGKPVDAINEVIDTIGFDDIVAETLNAKFWGYSIFEPTFWKNSSGKWEVSANLLPRQNYRPHLGVVAFDFSTDEGINIREGIYAKTIMEVGNPKDLGLLVSAAQYAILKRGGIGDYAMFVQVFGRPILDATWDGFDETQRIKLQESLNIGAGGTIIRPDGTSINILESKLTQSTIHSDFKKDMNAEISKALLGTTETTESSDSSGYAQSKEHGDQDDAKHDSDINYVRKVLNSRFIKVLEAAGFNTEGGSFIIQGEETKLSTKESFEMHVKMVKELGLPIDDDFIYETYGVPKPDNYDQIKAERKALEAVTPSAAEVQKPTEDPKPKTKKPKSNGDVTLAMATAEEEEEAVKGIKSLVQKYIDKLKALFPDAPAVTTGATTGLAHTANCYCEERSNLVHLAFEDTFDNDALIQRFWDSEGKRVFDAELFKHTINNLLKGFKKGWDSEFIKLSLDLGMDYNIDDPAMLTSFEQNLFRFAGAKDLALAKRLNDLFKQSNSFREFYELASKETAIFNKDWLETEYYTAVSTGEAAATYRRLLGQTDTFPYWEYKTAGDNHVRKEHAKLAGIILPWNDPRWQKIFPPNGWNCRCRVAPRLKSEFNESKLKADQARADAYIASPEFVKLTAQGWGVNRASIGEVFTANQQYIDSMKFAYNQLNKLGAADFGLLKYAQAKALASQQAPIDDTIIDINEALDYANRKLKTPNGVNAAVLEALQLPDEVWLQFADVNNLIYIKYYAGKTWVSIGTLNDLELNLNTWFELSDDAVLQYRKGLLMYNK